MAILRLTKKEQMDCMGTALQNVLAGSSITPKLARLIDRECLDVTSRTTFYEHLENLELAGFITHETHVAIHITPAPAVEE